MDFAPGAIALDDIIGGTLQAGEVPNARLESELTSLADALTAGGRVPHANLTGYLVPLAEALTGGGNVPNSKLTPDLTSLANALTPGGVVPHANLTGYLVTLANALKSGGIVPRSKSIKTEYSFRNSGAIVLSPVFADIMAVTLTDITGGSRFIVSTAIELTKGIGGGPTVYKWYKNGGTGGLDFIYDAQPDVEHSNTHHGAALPWFAAWTIVGRATAGGSPVLQLAGTSQGSNATVAINAAKSRVWIIAGD